MTPSSVFLGALATDQIVGRENELSAIQQAVSPHDSYAFTCLILQASGGKGKTRLLREVEDRFSLPKASSRNPAQGTWHNQTTLLLSLIDLGDIALHSVVSFLREVRVRFGTISALTANDFVRSDAAWLEYEIARDGQAEYAKVAETTRSLLAAFVQDYEQLTKRYRVIWVLDTLEQLSAIPREVAELLGAVSVTEQDLGSTTYTWLLDFIERKPTNTTLLLAGRPEPGRWLHDLQQVLPAINEATVAVADFLFEETDAYIRQLVQQLQQLPDAMMLAENLDQATNQTAEIEGLHTLTEGNPIRLALYVDLFVNAPQVPELFRDLKLIRNLQPAQIASQQAELDQVLLTYLENLLNEPEPQVLQYLSIMRRGLDRKRLTLLWGEGSTEAEIEAVFQSLQRFSFIKVRGDTLYLHDELYTIYQKNLVRQIPTEQDKERARQRDIFKRLVDFCTQRALDITPEIEALQNEPATPVPSDPKYLKSKEAIRTLRIERRQVRAERVHYSLYHDPINALNKVYFRMAGQAFLANETDLDEFIQAEIDSFFFGGNADLNRQQVGLSAEAWGTLLFHVLHERVARWIRRLTLIPELRNHAQALAAYAQTHHRAVVKQIYPGMDTFYTEPIGTLVNRLFLLEWQACHGFAGIYSGRNVAETARNLDQIIAELEQIVRTDLRSPTSLLKETLAAFRWRITNIIAECFEFAGFGYANIYDFKAAEVRYRRANLILESTRFRTLHAEVMNDLSRVLGELGAQTEAIALCNQGLTIRTEYGFDYLRALSTNTLALINTRNARPTRALYHANQALSLFRQINNPRGIALALIQVAEARRRIWGLTVEEAKNNPKSRSSIDPTLLTQVGPILREAEDLFGIQFRSDGRLIEVWIELGCLYRDWVTFFGIEQAQAEYKQAQNYFRQAIELAKTNTYAQHELSALINLAWMYGKCGQFGDATHSIQQAISVVDASYVFTTERAIDPTKATNVVNYRELSKLSSLNALVLAHEPDTFADQLRERVFAITYLQLYSSYKPYYMDVNHQHVTDMVQRAVPPKGQSKQEYVATLLEQIIWEYHLAELETKFEGGLQAHDVVQKAFNQSEETIDYLLE